jgi:DNA (cytosine-5)-methyltransferase 1
MSADKKRLATDCRDKNQTEQTVGTDPAFFAVLDKKYNFGFDLACTAENCVCEAGFYFPHTDALVQDWAKISIEAESNLFSPWLYLNPPYKNIEPWAGKCKEESKKGAKIIMLVPASVGSNWFREHVFGQALVFFLSPRLKFVGHNTPYPKDLMCCVFSPAQNSNVFCWNWKKDELTVLKS